MHAHLLRAWRIERRRREALQRELDECQAFIQRASVAAGMAAGKPLSLPMRLRGLARELRQRWGREADGIAADMEKWAERS